MKSDESSLFNQEIMQWKDVVERLNAENNDLKTVIEDLELKNRKLIDKINE